MCIKHCIKFNKEKSIHYSNCNWQIFHEIKSSIVGLYAYSLLYAVHAHACKYVQNSKIEKSFATKIIKANAQIAATKKHVSINKHIHY